MLFASSFLPAKTFPRFLLSDPRQFLNKKFQIDCEINLGFLCVFLRFLFRLNFVCRIICALEYKFADLMFFLKSSISASWVSQISIESSSAFFDGLFKKLLFFRLGISLHQFQLYHGYFFSSSAVRSLGTQTFLPLFMLTFNFVALGFLNYGPAALTKML